LWWLASISQKLDFELNLAQMTNVKYEAMKHLNALER